MNIVGRDARERDEWREGGGRLCANAARHGIVMVHTQSITINAFFSYFSFFFLFREGEGDQVDGGREWPPPTHRVKCPLLSHSQFSLFNESSFTDLTTFSNLN